MKAYGTALTLRTLVESFWNSYYAFPSLFDGLVERRVSTQAVDTFARLGNAPMPQQWVGDREMKDVNEYSYTLTNVAWEGTVKIDKSLIKYQQIDAVARLVGNLGTKARAHQDYLLSQLVENGHTSTNPDDGQLFFDTDHQDPGAEYATDQSNDLTGIATTDDDEPTDLEKRDLLDSLFDAVYGFKDDRGDPFFPPGDLGAENWVLMVPNNMRGHYRRMATSSTLDTGAGSLGNTYQGAYELRVNPWLTGDATADVPIFLFAKGQPHRPFILNESGGVDMFTEIEPKSGDTMVSATWWGQVTYGNWRTAVRNFHD